MAERNILRFGDRIREERLRQGLTAREVAYRARTTEKAVSLIENGKVDSRVSLVIRVAAALGLGLILIPKRPAAEPPKRQG